GFGSVFDGSLRVVFKKVPVTCETEQGTKQLFKCTKDEIVLLTNLEHPNVIQLYDAKFVEPAQTFYLALEKMDGSVKDLGVITKDQACVVLREVGKALAYLHAAGVVHLDIKGENVLIKRGTSQSSPAQVKLIDFNLSTKLDEDGFTRSTCGTAWCMAPENARRYQGLTNERFGPAADAWSSFILLFEITHGYWPNDDLDQNEILDDVCASDGYANDIKSSKQFVAENVLNLKYMFFADLHSDPSWRLPIETMVNDCCFLHNPEVSVLDEPIQRMLAEISRA
ncbi:ULK kinase, partial [Aphelenchoides avenae]